MTLYQYAVKFVCGKSNGQAVAPGEYWTAINVHNPTASHIRFKKKFAIALPNETPGKVTRFFETRLGPDEAFEIDRKDIFKHTGIETEFLKGFAIIESEVDLDIVAVYTTAGRDGHVVSIHTERVLPRRQELGCCSKIGGVNLDFSRLPLSSGPVPSTFTFEKVDFTRIYKEITFKDGSLWCMGSEESPPNSNNWYPATVKLDFNNLPCKVCKIIAEVDGHGPEARIEGKQVDGGIQQAVCRDHTTLMITTTLDKHFISLILSGQEAQWFKIRLE